MTAKQWVQSVALALVSGVFVITVLGGVDDWPLTSSPMYSQYVTLDTPVFRFRVVEHVPRRIAEYAPSLPRIYPSANVWLFFYRFYTHYSFKFPRQRVLDDSPDRFEARMTRYFEAMIGGRKQALHADDRVELWVDRHVHRRRTHSYLVGSYLGSNLRFVLASRTAPVVPVVR